jgi:hypothetical protein
MDGLGLAVDIKDIVHQKRIAPITFGTRDKLPPGPF